MGNPALPPQKEKKDKNTYLGTLIYLPCSYSRSVELTRAALGSPAERAALGGGVYFTPPPLLSPKVIVRSGRDTRQSKALNEEVLMNTKIINFWVKAQVKLRLNVKSMIFVFTALQRPGKANYICGSHLMESL